MCSDTIKAETLPASTVDVIILVKKRAFNGKAHPSSQTK